MTPTNNAMLSKLFNRNVAAFSNLFIDVAMVVLFKKPIVTESVKQRKHPFNYKLQSAVSQG